VGQGLERILILAAGDRDIARRLGRDPSGTAGELGVLLTPTERRTLTAICPSRLATMIDGLRRARERRAFLQRAGAGVLALTAACEGSRTTPPPTPTPAPRSPGPDAALPDSRRAASSARSSTYFGELRVSDVREQEPGEPTIGLGTLGTITGSRPDHPVQGEGRLRARHTVEALLGQSTIKGQLAPEVFRRIVRQHINELRYCFEKTLGLTPTAMEVRLSLSLTIDAAGQVTRARAEEQGKRRARHRHEACAAAALRRWLFPRPRDQRPIEAELDVVFRVTPAARR
jgi:hypothetical protein